MGRALKIQKTNIGAGTSVSGSTTSYNQNVLTDAGYPNFGSLTKFFITSMCPLCGGLKAPANSTLIPFASIVFDSFKESSSNLLMWII